MTTQIREPSTSTVPVGASANLVWRYENPTSSPSGVRFWRCVDMATWDDIREYEESRDSPSTLSGSYLVGQTINTASPEDALVHSYGTLRISFVEGTLGRLSSQRKPLPSYICRWIAETADGEEEIVAALRECGLDLAARRVNYLREVLLEEPDEPYLVLESLRSLALFLMSERQLPPPRISVDSGGLAQAEWRIHPQDRKISHNPNNQFWGRGDGIIVMKFLSSGLVRYVALSGPTGQGIERIETGGVLPKASVMDSLQMFTYKLFE